METPSSDPIVGSLRSLRLVAFAILAVLLVQLGVMSLPPLAAVLAAKRLAKAQSVTPTEALSPDAGKGVGAEVAHGSGGPIRTVLGMGIVLNKESSLEREWTTVNAAGMPARLVGPASVVTVYKPSSYSGEYQYSVAFDVDAMEPLTALEVRFLTFDVWGDKGRSLSMTTVEDLPVGKKSFHGAWRIFAENEAEEYYASVAYIARARTKSGRVISADPDPVVREAKRFSEKFSVADLAPQPTAVPTPPSSKQ